MKKINKLLKKMKQTITLKKQTQEIIISAMPFELNLQ